MKFIYLLLLGFISQISYAQCDDTVIYSDIEKESFVQAYLFTKKEKPLSQDAVLYELATKHSISPKQFQEIQDPQQAQRSLSTNEVAFVSELHTLQLKYEEDFKIVEQNKCKELDLDYSKYRAMRHQYRSCMRFQRSLSAHFNKWMK